MKKKKFMALIFLFAIFVLILNGKMVRVEANEEQADLVTIGTYFITEPVDRRTKVYVQKEMIDYLSKYGIEIKSEKRNWFIRDYYYEADTNIEKVIGAKTIKNDIESLIFMVNELEKLAIKKSINHYKNDTLGFIRTINNDYYKGYFGKWTIVAGEPPYDFLNLVNEYENNRIGLTFDDYFSRFINKDQYNFELHKNLKIELREKGLMLVDPVNPNKRIDLIHMIASIDGIYRKTYDNTSLGKAPSLGLNNMQRDVVSWNGDLQQAMKKISEQYEELYSEIQKPENGCMKLIFDKDKNGDDKYSCPEDDILADIDAMNITKIYVDHDNTNITNSLIAYYNFLKKDYKKRFNTFIETVLIDEERPTKIVTDNKKVRFSFEVFSQFNIELSEKGYKDAQFYKEESFPGFMIMRSGKTLKERAVGKIPQAPIRYFVAKSFVDYVEHNAEWGA